MYYQINRETQKLELIFNKAEYQALSEEMKREIKSNFLFARSVGGWVSRCKFPNLYYAEKVAQKLGAENRGKTGETLSFAEQQEKKAERAEARAERMDYRSIKAAAEGERLQKPINDMRGGIAFFTQPNINSSAGRAFTNRRNKMFAAYERGFEEFKKSEYYAERADIARQTAADAKAPKDKAFCERRIAEAEKTIRAQKKNISIYEKALAQIEKGIEYVGNHDEWYCSYKPGDEQKLNEYIERAEEITEQAISKVIYYREAIESMGGIQFSRENVKPGYIVKVKRWGCIEVSTTGPKNFKAKSYGWPMSYAEIIEIVKAEEAKPEQHPFKVGDTFTPELWNSESLRIEKTPFEVIKATDKSVTVKNMNTGKTYIRKPQKRESSCYETGFVWCFFLDDNYSSGCFKTA